MRSLKLITPIVFAAIMMVWPGKSFGAQIFMAPDGSNKASGLTRSEAVRSLGRAREIARRLIQSKPAKIQILVAPGTYLHQSVNWNVTHPATRISIQALDPNRRPVFDGRRGRRVKSGTFFYTRKRNGRTNITIRNLVIQNYRAALNFHGNQRDYTRFNSHNRILSNLFLNIGDKYWDRPSKPGFAAIHLTNSRNNLVRNNVFLNIENFDNPDTLMNESGLVHAIYLAHFAEENVIDRNSFINVSGQAVKIRNFSNFNKFTNNTFNRTGKAAFQDWACGSWLGNPCVKHFKKARYQGRTIYRMRECPSWATVFRNNQMGMEYYTNGRLPALEVYPAHYPKNFKIDYCRSAAKFQIEDFKVRPDHPVLAAIGRDPLPRLITDVKYRGKSCLIRGKTVRHGQSVTLYKSARTSPGKTCAQRRYVRRCAHGVLRGSPRYNRLSCRPG